MSDRLLLHRSAPGRGVMELQAREARQWQDTHGEREAHRCHERCFLGGSHAPGFEQPERDRHGALRARHGTRD